MKLNLRDTHTYSDGTTPRNERYYIRAVIDIYSQETSAYQFEGHVDVMREGEREYGYQWWVEDAEDIEEGETVEHETRLIINSIPFGADKIKIELRDSYNMCDRMEIDILKELRKHDSI